MKNNSFFNNISTDITKLEKTKKNSMIKINMEAFKNLIDSNYSNDRDVNYFLEEKTHQIFELQANSSLELGKIFTEAFNKLSGNNHYDGLYEKWLGSIGFNKMTALRHRKRYELYNEVLEDHSKNIIALMPVRVLTEIINNPEKDNLLKIIEENKEFKITDIKGLLKKDELVLVDSQDEAITFKEIESLKKINIKKMDIKKINQLKDELEKMLEDVKKVLENF